MSGRRTLACAAAALALAAGGCGGSSRTASTPPTAATSAAADSTPSATAATPAPARAPASHVRMSPAKRRYLDHFTTGCGGSDKLANATATRLQALVAQITGGDVSAVGRLTRFLAQLSNAFGQGLARMRSLGPPPGPDAAAGRSYIAQAARLVGAIRRLGRAVGRLNAPGIATANAELRSATSAAHAAAAQYGFETCGSSSSAGPAGNVPVA